MQGAPVLLPTFLGDGSQPYVNDGFVEQVPPPAPRPRGRKGKAAELSAAGGVAYSDLCVGDVYDWLAATFFGASREDLTPAQAPPPHVAPILRR